MEIMRLVESVCLFVCLRSGSYESHVEILAMLAQVVSEIAEFLS